MKLLEDMTEPELKDVMNTMARGIEMIAERMDVEKPLFVLLLFNDPQIGQYISNCERSTTIAAMRETAERLEKRQDVTR